MFEKMTPRERKLLIAISWMLPIALVFIGVFSFFGRYNENNEQLGNLEQTYNEQDNIRLDGMSASKRRAYYNALSLPPNIQTSANEYQSWLNFLLKELQIDYKSVTPRAGSDFTFERKLIGRSKKFNLTATCTLTQLTDFMARFYSADLLHRINKLKITPKNEIVRGGREKKIRTGQLSFAIEIEILSLKTAADDPEFTQRFQEASEKSLKLQEFILQRDVFGEANNPPVLAARPAPKYFINNKISVNLSATDADEEDDLTIELLESSVEGAELKWSEGARRAKLLVPSQKEPRRLKFKAKVTDNGLPKKESIKEFTLNVQAPPEPKNAGNNKKDPPPFLHAPQTWITAFWMEDGQWQVWVKVRSSNKKYKLFVGDSFKLDKKDWVVEKIGPRTAVFSVDGKRLKFNDRVPFDKPLKNDDEDSTEGNSVIKAKAEASTLLLEKDAGSEAKE